MSRAHMENLARRWHCSVKDVADRIHDRLKVAGLIDSDSDPILLPEGTKGPVHLTIAVSPDDQYYVQLEDGRYLSLDTGIIVRGTETP